MIKFGINCKNVDWGHIVAGLPVEVPKSLHPCRTSLTQMVQIIHKN